MMELEKYSISILGFFSPEFSRNISHKFIERGLFPVSSTEINHQNLRTQLGNIQLNHPLGIPSGLDKNATSIKGLFKTGISFLELGTVTPNPQYGNDKPRLFRIASEKEFINRFGLNNHGAKAIASRLKQWSGNGIIGLSVGYNKNSNDPFQDFLNVIAECGIYADYLALNISCPNIDMDLDLSTPENLSTLLQKISLKQKDLGFNKPLYLKLSPDYEPTQLNEIISVSLDEGVNGFIATNSTISRPFSSNPIYQEGGGLTGAYLFEISTKTLARVYAQTQGSIPIIGVGGISSAEDAYIKIKAGASALQLYTALCYQGTGLIKEIGNGLSHLLEKDGYSNITEAVGIEHQNWLI
ncbi:MAG: quinone-dependent dihydroorotate dehydrogenase [Rhodobacteraceae bacterium]|nr:quinone-dependent dihydroorotate dehydrogenase [Paracoccaceae bacterium]